MFIVTFVKFSLFLEKLHPMLYMVQNDVGQCEMRDEMRVLFGQGWPSH
jgi:hypothetical protein